MITVRTIHPTEVDAFRHVLMTNFGEDAEEADPNGTPRLNALIAPGHAWGAFDGATMVGTAGTFDLELGIPGGTLPVAGLTMVSVRPTHRRRGILRELMASHLADAREKRYAVSGLWASESSIYGRFGYGLASHSDSLEITGPVRFTDSWEKATLDELAPVDEETARVILPAIYERTTASRPGVLRRGDVWWRERRFLETPFMRKGASRRRHVIARRGGEAVGYVAYRQRPAFVNGLPGGRIEINELFAIDPRAEATLWRFVLAIDLHPTVTWWNAPVDCPLPWMLADSRRVMRKRADNLWLRIEDVPAALSARGYTHDGRLRFAVDGTTWELAVEGGRGQCTPSSAAPQLELAQTTLGALYLGGTTASALALAGLVRGDAGAVAHADYLFGSVVAPWCPEIF